MTDLEKMNKAELVQLAKKKKLAISSADTKARIIEKLTTIRTHIPKAGKTKTLKQAAPKQEQEAFDKDIQEKAANKGIERTPTD